jgi:ribosomal protein L11 methyltransferase
MASSRRSLPQSQLTASLETDAQGAHRLADAFAERFGGEAAVSIVDAGHGRWRVTLYVGRALEAETTRELARIAGVAASAVRFRRVAAADWVQQSLAGLKPVAAGRFVVHGAHDRAGVAPNRIGVEIEAALAFGTGHHGTTRGCLLALDAICKAQGTRRGPVRRMLDLGTGSGVLAIAAARALRRRVLATDIDPQAVRAARANARRNGAGPLVEIVRADGVAGLHRRGPFDLVFANILLAPLQRFAAPLTQLAAPGARIVLSGILPAQANAVIAAYYRLTLLKRIDCDGWSTLVFARPSTLPCRGACC